MENDGSTIRHWSLGFTDWSCTTSRRLEERRMGRVRRRAVYEKRKGMTKQSNCKKRSFWQQLIEMQAENKPMNQIKLSKIISEQDVPAWTPHSRFAPEAT